MHNYRIRLMTMDDAAEGAKLWHTVFGDDEALVMEFFRLFGYQQGFGACAELDGSIAAAAYCPMGTDYIAPHGNGRKGAYLYAVATHPDHRKQGLAKELCLLLRNTVFAQGADDVFTKPSEESLYSWYEEKIGAVPRLGGQTVHFLRTANGSLPVTQLTASEYADRRRKLLYGLPHVRHSSAWLEWEGLLHQAYGGGFYAVDDHIATAYCDGETLQIGEFLPHPTEDAVQSLLWHTGALKAVCTLRGDAHYVSVVSKDGILPTDNPWFGPCYG